MDKPRKAVTLLELIIAIVLLSVIVLGLANIDVFSRFQVINSDRRISAQNEASLALAQMSQELPKAIGNEMLNGANSVVNTGTVSSDTALRVYIDSDASGGIGDGVRDTVNDRWIAYRWTEDPDYQLWYCPDCTDGAACSTCNPVWGDPANIVAKRINSVVFTKPQDAQNRLNKNFVAVKINACWDPQASSSINNPCTELETNFTLPSVSVN